MRACVCVRACACVCVCVCERAGIIMTVCVYVASVYIRYRNR